jgi:hypothetical protein
MKTELYNKIFQRLDELGAIYRTEVYLWPDSAPWADTHSPVLSDVLNAMDMMYGIWANGKWNISYVEETIRSWNLSKPYLKDQSDELGEKLYSLIK